MPGDDGTVLFFKRRKAVNAPAAAIRGRVLVVGGRERSRKAVEKLTAQGFDCASVDTASNALAIAAALRPEAVFVASAVDSAREVVRTLRSDQVFRELPVLADFTGGSAEQIRALGVDDCVHSDEELASRLESALKARRLVERDAISRQRMEVLLEIADAATSSLELDQILGIAVDKISKVISADRCSVILVEGNSPRVAHVVASKETPHAAPMPLDLARYPELRRALETRQTVRIEDAMRDPMMDEVRRTILPLGVRSILVQPLICQDDLLGALFLRLSRADGGFGREEAEFAQAVAAALANSVRNARLHQALRRKREDLESAYVDRYRELSEANKRLKELNRLKDEIIAVCSHDMRSPLNVLLGHGRLLLDSQLKGQDKSSVEAMVRQGKKILELVESLLERGKGEQSRLCLEARKLDVSELAKETTSELQILANQRGVTLRSETPESLLVVGDEVKLREVLENLITNAMHHAPGGGEVVVRAQKLKRPDGDTARLMVQDNGAGIPPDQIHLVFDRYRHGPGGVGLGLAICREFVDLHGGEIWAETPAVGGCAFVFTLPMVRDVDPSAQQAHPEKDDQLPRVLVVEDEPEVAAVVEEIFRSRYRVEVARDGTEGLAKARALRPDLVVMDVFLPKMDGLDAAAALKASSDTADIPVILLSAHQGVADKLRALNMGAVDYLAKPFQSLELLACAERALTLKKTERELLRSQSLLRQAGSDPETGQLDRSGFVLRLEQELSRAQRYGRALTVAYLQPSAPVGEGARSIALRLRQTLRSPDVVGHLGGGAFVVALPECAVPEVQATVARLIPVLHQELGVSFRVAVIEAKGAQPDVLLERLLSTAVA